MEPVGTWNQLTSLNLTRVNAVSALFTPVNVMANRTFIVTTVEAPPYTMLTEETKKMTGNDRFEGMISTDNFKYFAPHFQVWITKFEKRNTKFLFFL